MDILSQCLSDILNDTRGKNNKFESITFWNGNKIDASLLKKFLEINGFRTLKINGVSKVVKLTCNIVEVFTPQDVFNYCFEFIEARNSDLESDFIDKGEKFLMTKKALLGSLRRIELGRYRDDNITSRHFYNNGIVEIKANEIQMLSYSDFQKRNEYIFKDVIINRPFQLETIKVSQFEKFLKLSTNSDRHFQSVCSSIGYCLHRFKNPANAKAIILSDLLSQATNEANGRSGKGLIIKAIGEFINVIEYNGKNLDLKRDKFVYQSIDHSTDLFVIQDVSKSFDFEDLFSQITDKMDVQRKHIQKMIIEFKDSPKIAITTNYTIPQNTASYADRKQLIILNNYFNAYNKPERKFKNLFFLEWNNEEYKAFDKFMMTCIQTYLKKGLTNYDDPELMKQNLVNNTSKLFIELMESDYSSRSDYFSLKELASKLEINSSEKTVKSKIAKQWLKVYSEYMNLKLDTRKSGGFDKFCLNEN